jgi:hypothetical protein
MDTTGIDLSKMNIILDHNTLVFYGLYQNMMYFCSTDASDPNSFKWTLQNQSPFPSNYGQNSVVGFGQNHLYFLNSPSLLPGHAIVYVIHYAYWQPEIQLYKGPTFPQIHGQTVSFSMLDNSVPLVFGFVPDDFSG